MNDANTCCDNLDSLLVQSLQLSYILVFFFPSFVCFG